MKALTERLDALHDYIASHKETDDPDAHQAMLDTWLELNAIAEVLPEITIAIPQPPPGQRRLQHRRIEIEPWDRVVAGGRSATK